MVSFLLHVAEYCVMTSKGLLREKPLMKLTPHQCLLKRSVPNIKGIRSIIINLENSESALSMQSISVCWF